MTQPIESGLAEQLISRLDPAGIDDVRGLNEDYDKQTTRAKNEKSRANKWKKVSCWTMGTFALTFLTWAGYQVLKPSSTTENTPATTYASITFEEGARHKFYNLTDRIHSDAPEFNAIWCEATKRTIDGMTYGSNSETDEKPGVITLAEVQEAEKRYNALRAKFGAAGIRKLVSEDNLEGLFPKEVPDSISYDPLRNINRRTYRTLERTVANYNHGRNTGRANVL